VYYRSLCLTTWRHFVIPSFIPQKSAVLFLKKRGIKKRHFVSPIIPFAAIIPDFDPEKIAVFSGL